ncbi:Peptide chain release factor 3 [Neochlamydia sp. EPS4]|uniref:peptide chain release factor 3 n=2 Tax=unclassified Neochlamydia TaxID=2643326 RepID=UPI000582F889|nr:peptide chain release factor 3 [Neochlamydia sp. EPS4]KIC75242.1 Peptide chain release factor 3 [Neochlamydia sp. EPS4]
MSPLENKVDLQAEIFKRRTFAIISHPDAGKTTLTEKLLLYSGMLHTAGIVRGRKGRKAAASDWMAMEQERGISITSSAMQFPYKETLINILDTPGHEDFSEDTYRTLTAADCAIMVIDAAKGVEKQTRKLFEVCRLRKIPVLTFINKMDMPGRDPLDLMNEVENVLGIQSTAFNWPIGCGASFKGVYDRLEKQVLLFAKTSVGGAQKAEITRYPLNSPEIVLLMGEEAHHHLMQELELLEMAGNPFDYKHFLAGNVTPVFFASALTNFGVEPFFDAFIHLAPPPQPRLINLNNGEEKTLDPVEAPFSAYAFKIQANMDKKHRDSMAFLRICSGRFERDMLVKHHRTAKEVRLSRPHGMLAGERTIVDTGYAGDVIGVINPGVFSVGDTISTKGGFNFKPIPHFQPEIFAHVSPKDVGKRKSFDKGVYQLTEEGAIQLLKPYEYGAELIFAAVGQLQFEVMQYRLKDEYGVDTTVSSLPYKCSAWLLGDIKTFQKPSNSLIVQDRYNRPIALFTETWEKQYAVKQNLEHQLVDIL